MTELRVDLQLDFPAFSLALAHDFPLSGITALFGPSGCGKSTVLRVIAGLERGADGRVAFGSETWQAERLFVRPHLRGVGYVFQDTRLFPHLSVEGNLRYAERRSSRGDGRIRWPDVIGALDIGPLLARRPASLSGGERQRVAIGRTLLTRPRLLLMDEPLAALDRGRKADLYPHIGNLPEIFGLSVIYVTHSIGEVTLLANRIVALADGRLLAAGGVAETLEKLDLTAASGRFEAGAVVEGRVTGIDRRFLLTEIAVAGQTIRMPGTAQPVGETLRLRVRARDVALAVIRPEGLSIRNILSGHVAEIVVEADTAFAEVLVDIGEGQRLRSRITRAAVSDLSLAEGSPVFALVKSIAFDRRALPRAAEKGGYSTARIGDGGGA